MDWITGISHAIDYIEENLTNELSYSEIAKEAYSSSYNFQRVFSILCGMTLGEYIRKRRLTLAGSELASSNAKVIDVALKYAYDSPESFSRAFSKFHGVTPSEAKLYGNNLKSFSKLSVKLVLEGGTTMNYRIEEMQDFTVIEKAITVNTEKDESLSDIPKFWQDCSNNGTINTLCDFMQGADFNNGIMGIAYSDSCDNKHMTYSIASGYNGKPVPNGYRVNTIGATTWAIFKCKGAVSTAIHETFKRIYTEFFPTSDYSPKNDITIEAYPYGDFYSDDYECEIWIAVEKK